MDNMYIHEGVTQDKTVGVAWPGRKQGYTNVSVTGTGRRC